MRKDLDGNVTAVQVSDLSVDEAEELGATIGALIGLGFDGEDGMVAGASWVPRKGPTDTSSLTRRCTTSPTPIPPAAPQPWP